MSTRPILFAVATAFFAAPARAGNSVEIFAQAQGGWADGSGSSEATPVAGEVEAEKRDFYDVVGGGAYGLQAGVKVLGFEAYGDFLKFADSTPGGSIVRAMLGLRPEFGDDVVLHLRFGAGMMVGFFGDAEVAPGGVEVGKTPIGFTARGGVGIFVPFGGVFAIGPVADVGYYYLLNGTVQPDPDDVAAAREECGDDEACAREKLEGAGVGYETSSGIDYTALLALRVTLGF
ncbi:MAG: hypothetical protein AABZ30_09980 [Myxococcota bacterium]